jgi:hypothetical protein
MLVLPAGFASATAGPTVPATIAAMASHPANTLVVQRISRTAFPRDADLFYN